MRHLTHHPLHHNLQQQEFAIPTKSRLSVLSVSDILNHNAHARVKFTLFMKLRGAQQLVRFWLDVEHFKNTARRHNVTSVETSSGSGSRLECEDEIIDGGGQKNLGFAYSQHGTLEKSSKYSV